MTTLADLWNSYRERFPGGPLRRADRREWAGADTVADAGKLTARWLEGDLQTQPGYYGRPADETTDLIPTLAALNRAEYVTIGSQPGEGPVTGWDGREWWQRAAVDGLVAADDSGTLERIEKACADAGLMFIWHEGARRWHCDYTDAEPVTGVVDCAGVGHLLSGGDAIVLDVHTHFGTWLSRSTINLSFDGYLHEEMCAAHQVTVIDPVWGRNDVLWPTLLAALAPSDPALPALDKEYAEDPFWRHFTGWCWSCRTYREQSMFGDWRCCHECGFEYHAPTGVRRPFPDPVAVLDGLGARWSRDFDAYATGEIDTAQVRCLACGTAPCSCTYGHCGACHSDGYGPLSTRGWCFDCEENPPPADW